MRSPAGFQQPPPPHPASSGPLGALSLEAPAGGVGSPLNVPHGEQRALLSSPGEKATEGEVRPDDEMKAQVAALLLKRQFRSVLRHVTGALQPELPPDRLLQWLSVKVYALLSLKDAAGIEAELQALPHPLSSSFWTYERHRHIYPVSDETTGSLIPFCLHLFLAAAPSICTPSAPSGLDAIYALLRFCRNQLGKFCEAARCSCAVGPPASPARNALLRLLVPSVSASSSFSSSPFEDAPAGATHSPSSSGKQECAGNISGDSSREGKEARDARSDALHALWLERLTIVAFLAAEILVARGHPQEALQLLQEEILPRRQQRQHIPTLSLMGRISLRMSCLDLAEEFFGYVECLSERESVVTRTNNGLLALLSRDATAARREFEAGQALARAGEEERRQFLLGVSAFETSREEVHEAEQARQAAALPGWATKRLAAVTFPSALASTAANLAVANLYDKKLYEATVALECAMERHPEESLFVGGVRNLLTLYEFSLNKQTCLPYLSNLILTAAAEDQELAALVAP
ncbi:hypothetical protein TGARI_294960 [Toxoplasma gondii ARI]|uniref:Uncharacterized protein n=1 Tax=Toxoplasma gondii ARI TaxID=1074872 RepID=A0A139XLK2_TOXGO|nr:hypothetical protein TGARI_294960 [Toxoplasma gondii ARI]